MLLTQPFQHKRGIVGASIVDKYESDVFRPFEKIAERLRLKPQSFIEAGHNDDDAVRSRVVTW